LKVAPLAVFVVLSAGAVADATVAIMPTRRHSVSKVARILENLFIKLTPYIFILLGNYIIVKKL